MPDSLRISDIRAYGYTGFLPEEQVLGQWYTVDLRIWLDLSLAAANDDIAQTYDYRAVVKDVQTLIQTKRFKLVERLTEAIAQRILASELVEQVQVQLTKVSPPIPDFTGSVTVDITRRRDAMS
ncbi:dihydroneopterin aldolase [Vacuolonema iberomarrocanum]|uniref:dihydroneopterin aldolase n=1 Tax=Vacuolonema iberomarrocanum TaxID=3454632 RepID=UPI0019F331F8|nr:dihydroneopterin aldolase [filamentous cyanobacterium LEGE 07170]